MKALFDEVSFAGSRLVTKKYSTSFSSAVQLLSPRIRQDIYNIYGFVRLADEIVDSFTNYDQPVLFERFKEDLQLAFSQGISTNPILNAFQFTALKFSIPMSLINAFMDSMEADLSKSRYFSKEEYDNYIYGSADVVGLMCLKVFVSGNDQKFDELKASAMRLGSAFQKVNFLRDLKADHEELNRCYFPNADLSKFDEELKKEIISDIEADLREGLKGIAKLPLEAKLGVYLAYVYYSKLLAKLKKVPAVKIMVSRIRVPGYQKLGLFAKGYMNYKLRMI